MPKRFYDATGAVFAVASLIGGEDSFTESAEFDRRRPFNLSISGTFVATLTLQRSFDNGATWHDVETLSSPAEKIVDTPESDVLWRCGAKSGEYTSGSASIRLSQ